MRAMAATRRLSTTSTTSCATLHNDRRHHQHLVRRQGYRERHQQWFDPILPREVRGARLDDVSGHVDARYGLKSPAVSVFTPVCRSERTE